METLKYKFEIPNVKIVDGDVVEDTPTEYECMFSLTVKSLELFEEETGRVLLNALFSDEQYTTKPEYIRALACCCYFKIDGNSFVQNESTKDEFKKMPFYKTLGNDSLFIVNLQNMVIKSIAESNEKAKKANPDLAKDNSKAKK